MTSGDAPHGSPDRDDGCSASDCASLGTAAAGPLSSGRGSFFSSLIMPPAPTSLFWLLKERVPTNASLDECESAVASILGGFAPPRRPRPIKIDGVEKRCLRRLPRGHDPPPRQGTDRARNVAAETVDAHSRGSVRQVLCRKKPNQCLGGAWGKQQHPVQLPRPDARNQLLGERLDHTCIVEHETTADERAGGKRAREVPGHGA